MQHSQQSVEIRIQNFMDRKMEQFPELKRKTVSEAQIIRNREHFFSAILDAFATKRTIIGAK